MINKIYHFLSFIIVLILSKPLFAQQEYEDTCSIRNDLNQMFSLLDKSRVPTGLLMDYSVNLIDLDIYDGLTINNQNYTTYEINMNLSVRPRECK